jgi:hypothetical protein
MWIFTRYGFFSVVCARSGSGRADDPIDPERAMVRARVHEHLVALVDRFSGLLRDVTIHESASADYAYRLFVEKDVWERVLSALAAEMDYDNFKGEVARPRKREVPGRLSLVARLAYEEALHDVWEVMYRLQRRPVHRPEDS